jgi:hypothetical protein
MVFGRAASRTPCARVGLSAPSPSRRAASGLRYGGSASIPLAKPARWAGDIKYQIMVLYYRIPKLSH